MRISSGMAEIGFNNLPGMRVASERFFIWPLYNAGRVESIQGVTRRMESNVIYSKPSQPDHDRIMDFARDRSFSEYSPAGRTGRTHCGIRPGALFEAIA